jgi:hypothetical protein
LRSEATEQSRIGVAVLDWFASLAMTRNYPATLPHFSARCSAPRSAVAKMV